MAEVHNRPGFAPLSSPPVRPNGSFRPPRRKQTSSHAARTIPKVGHEDDEEIELDFGDTGRLHDVIAPPGYQGAESNPAEEAGWRQEHDNVGFEEL